MWIQNFFKSLTSTPTRRRPIRRPSPASRLCLETLEDRCLPSFLPAVSYPVGANPQAVVTGDFNGDGQLDLAVANTNDSSVSVLLGKANGTFQPAQRFSAGTGHINGDAPGPVSLAVGDFNDDGKLDLVTINSSYDLSILLSNGDGTFQPTTTFASGIMPAVYGAAPSVAVGDLNGDGKLDLVVNSKGFVTTYVTYQGNSYSTIEYASVLLGHGDGTFSAPTRYATGAVLDGIDAAPPFVAVAD